MGLTAPQAQQFGDIMVKLVRLFQDKDLTLVEVNPLVITDEGKLHCLDAKVAVDDNALFRHPDLLELRDTSQEDENEIIAAEHEFSYVALDGNIGCMVNGAGLAMATMDMVKLQGGEPANFLDVGGRTSPERVAQAFKVILTDKGVTAIFVNIFGGIVRCDVIAEGILKAVKEVGLEVPVIVRLEGNNAQKGLEIVKEAGGTSVLAAASMDEAVSLAVKSAN